MTKTETPETTAQMTDAQALDEAVLRFTRKARRLFGTEFSRVWNQLPDGAKNALYAAERRADVHRDEVGDPRALVWPVEVEDDEKED